MTETMFRGGRRGAEREDGRADAPGERLAVLHDAARRFPEAETREEVAAVLVDAAADLPALRCAVAYLHDSGADELYPAARAGDASGLHDELPRVDGSGADPVAAAFDGGESIIYESRSPGSAEPHPGPEGSQPAFRPVDDDAGVRRALFVPLGDHGVVVAGDDAADRFDPRVVERAETLFATARSALDRVEREAELRERERRLRRRRVQFETLADLYALVGDVNAAALRQSTREEVERLVCERVADSDAFDLAWMAALDRTGDGVAVKACAGRSDPVDELDADGSPPAGPTGRALRTQEPQIVEVDPDDGAAGAWTTWAARHGFRAVAAVPVAHEGTLYGVLTLCSSRPTAFDDRERTVVARLGEFVGHALAAIERTAALTSDDLVELELRLPGMMDAVLGDGSMDGRVDIDRTVPTGDGSFLQFARATPAATDGFEALLSALPHVEAFARVSERDDEVRYRIEQSDPPLMSIVADEGGLVRGSVIEEGSFEMYVDLPVSADVRTVVETLRDEYPEVELVAQRRTVRREDPRQAARDALSEELTDRQRVVLEVAYYAGFFEWPRDATAEELAETMSVSSPTIHHHLRKALGKVLAAIFERGPADRDALT